jgi:hypothetical protein
MLNLSLENVERLRAQSGRCDTELLRGCIMELSKALSEAKWAPKPRILVELAIIKMCSRQ